MNVSTLATVAAILDRGSFAAAAQAVGCTPSAVSLQVKQLETYFGQPLFDRSSRTVRPTPLAREVGEMANDVAARLEKLRARPTTKVAGRVRLGAIATVQTDVLPQALRRLRDRHPALDVEISLNDSDALQAELKAGRIDVAVLVRPQSGGSSRLLWQDLVKQPFVMLVPPGLPTGSPRDLLQRMGLIRYDTSLTGGRIAARYVRGVCPEARNVMELRSIDAIVAMVAAGLGVAVVPRPRAPLLEACGVREVRLGSGAPVRQITIVRRRGDAESRNIDAVLEAFSSVYGVSRPCV